MCGLLFFKETKTKLDLIGRFQTGRTVTWTRTAWRRRRRRRWRRRRRAPPTPAKSFGRRRRRRRDARRRRCRSTATRRRRGCPPASTPTTAASTTTTSTTTTTRRPTVPTSTGRPRFRPRFDSIRNQGLDVIPLDAFVIDSIFIGSYCSLSKFFSCLI